MTAYRSAVTGEYVTEEFAKANPDTTLKETTSETIARLEQQVEELKARLAALQGED